MVRNGGLRVVRIESGEIVGSGGVYRLMLLLNEVLTSSNMC